MKLILFVTLWLFSLEIFAQSQSPGKVEEQKQSPAIYQNNVAPATNSFSHDLDAMPAGESRVKSFATSQVQQLFLQFNSSHHASNQMEHRRTPTAAQMSAMQSNLHLMEAIGSESFEFNLGTYLVGRHDVSKINYLHKAAELNQFNKEVNIQMASYYTIVNDRSQRMSYLNNLFNAGHFSSDLLAYAAFNLSTLPQNAILITHGIDDTFPLLIQQDVHQTRGDVKIISLDMLQSQEYRKRLIRDGFNLPSSSVIDNQFLAQFCRLNNAKSLFVSLTLPKPYLQLLRADFTIKGLAMSNSTTSDYQNLMLYEENLNRLRGISQPFTSQGKAVYMNFLPCLISARTEAKQKKQQDLVRELELRIKEIAMWNNKWEQVQLLLND
jgi:hypothetical protein